MNSSYNFDVKLKLITELNYYIIKAALKKHTLYLHHLSMNHETLL